MLALKLKCSTHVDMSLSLPPNVYVITWVCDIFTTGDFKVYWKNNLSKKEWIMRHDCWHREREIREIHGIALVFSVSIFAVLDFRMDCALFSTRALLFSLNLMRTIIARCTCWNLMRLQWGIKNKEKKRQLTRTIHSTQFRFK